MTPRVVPRLRAAVCALLLLPASGATAQSGPGADGDDGGSGLLLLAAIAIPAVLLGVSRRRRSRRDQAELEEVKRFARDDLVALGEGIGELDLDVQTPGMPPGARADYTRALRRYEAADDAWRQARRPEDLERCTSLIKGGRHAIASVRARLEGRPLPERRPPCFFDPRHGPSAEDVAWAPPGGAARVVPVCAADARRIDDGQDPLVRQVRGVPYWDAGRVYLPWAAGFFGGGLLPGLFAGSILGNGFGMLGLPLFDGRRWSAGAAGASDHGGGRGSWPTALSSSTCPPSASRSPTSRRIPGAAARRTSRPTSSA